MINANLSQDQIKQLNRVKIIRFIKDKYETTKQEIAKTLKLSIPTVTTNINDLLGEGLIEEAGVAESTGGRKPVVLRFVENARYTIGVNITPKNVSILLTNLNSVVLANESFEYDDSVGFNGVLDCLMDKILRIIEDKGVAKRKVLGVGLALPGTVDDSALMLRNAPNINIQNYDFTKFEEKIGLKVFIENEANIAAYALLETEKMKNIDNLVYISVTEGIGTGIIVHNHIYKGTNKRAGEFGHHRISDEERICNCGRKGCYELYASNKALLRYYNDKATIKFSSIDQIFEEYSRSNIIAKEALEVYTAYLLKGIENIILGLSPDYVVVGGKIAKYADVLMIILGNKVRIENQYIEYEGCKVVFSELVDLGPLKGAALLSLEEVFNYRTNIL